MSSSVNSTWNYDLVTNATTAPISNPYKITSGNTDTSINGKIYHVFTNNTDGSKEYYNITGNNYYTYKNLPPELGGSKVENLYLKDNAVAGNQWSQSYPVTISGFPITVTLTNTIHEKDLTKVVNAISYTNVIHVTTTIAITGAPFPVTLTNNIQNYYAPKVGLIENDTQISFTITGFPPSNTDQQTILKASNIL